MLKMSEDVCLTKTIKNQMKNQEELNFLYDRLAFCLQIRFLAVDSYLLHSEYILFTIVNSKK